MLSLLNLIDLKRSKVIIVGHTIPFSAIYINPLYLSQADEIISKLEEKLDKLNKHSNGKISITVYKPKETYSNGSSKSPDLIISVNNRMRSSEEFLIKYNV